MRSEKMRVLSDFHHNSLMRSHVLLFEKRLGMDVYRPIGMDWYKRGFWKINDQEDTAKQFLDFDSQPTDGTPALNDVTKLAPANGTQEVFDPGHNTFHWACTLDFFMNNKFDYVIASIPQHVEPFKRLIELYNPEAKLIVQMGNNWGINDFRGYNILASIAPQPTDANVCYYHQEFDTKLFKYTPVEKTRRIHSYVNVIEHMPQSWEDYSRLKEELFEWDMYSYGGQCPDGNIDGAEAMAESIRMAEFVFHVKDSGDGYGHVIHNAYASGRPVITRKRHFKGMLPERLLELGTYIDLDDFATPFEAADYIRSLTDDDILKMGWNAAERFKEVVDFEEDARIVGDWLKRL